MQPTAQAVGSGSAITAEPRKGRKTTNARTPTGRSTRSRSPAVSGGTATPRSTDPWTFPQHYAVTSDLAFHSPVATSWSQPKGKSQKSARMTMGSSNSRCFKILATLSQQRACPASRRLVSPTPSIFCKQVLAPQDFARTRLSRNTATSCKSIICENTSNNFISRPGFKPRLFSIFYPHIIEPHRFIRDFCVT